MAITALDRPPRALRSDPIIAERNPFLAPANQLLYSTQYEKNRILSPAHDDALADFGLDIYWKMMLDPQVRSTITYPLRAAVTERLLSQPPPTLGEDDPEYKLALEIAESFSYSVEQCERPVQEWLFDLGLARGVSHRLAIPLYEPGSYRGKPMQLLSEVRVKPHLSYAFVVDRYTGWRGVIGRRPDTGAFPTVQELVEHPEWITRMSRVIHSAWDVKDHDPRGNALCRPMYGPWWNKINLYPAMMAYAATWAQPGVKIKVKNGNLQTDYFDAATNTTTRMTRSEAIARAVKGYVNGGVIQIDAEDEAEAFQVSGDGSVFERFLNLSNMEIAKAGTDQTMATEQSMHYTSSGGSVHENVLDTTVLMVKLWLGATLRRDLAIRHTVINFGEDKRHLTPWVSMGEIAPQDWAMVANAVSQLTSSGWLQEDQHPYTANRIGFPASKKPVILPSNRPAPLQVQQPGGGARPNKSGAEKRPAPGGNNAA
jgi:hypothetical protein